MCAQASCLCCAGICLRAEAAQPAARVCVNDAQSRAWLACVGRTCSCLYMGTCYDKTLPSVLLCMRWQGARIVPGHPVYVMLVPMVITGCLACAKTPEVYASVRRLHSLLPECVPMMPSQELGWPAEATLVYVLCRGPTRAGPPHLVLQALREWPMQCYQSVIPQ